MPFKPGGGDKPQLYKKENGEYCRNPICEEDEKNLIFQKLFNIKSEKQIAFPKVCIHDKDYCELYIRYCVNKKNQVIQDLKFTNYFFDLNRENTKYYLLKSMGYDLSNYKLLIKQIMINTDFNIIEDIRLNQFDFSFQSKTKIYNLVKERYDYIYTIWQVNENNCIRLITIKGGKNL